MLIIGIVLAAAGAFGLVEVRRRGRPGSAVACRAGAMVTALVMAAAAVLTAGSPVAAAIVPTVLLGTAADYAVLGASTVTNTGFTTLDGSLGLYPGTSVIGFPPGLVLPPGTTDVTNAVAEQAQSDLRVAYDDAANRPVGATTTADLVNLTLQAGVYAGPDHGALSLSGPLVLDGANNSSSVFIFQTDSSLITASGSTVTLINGAQACNVFWQVGSSATLGTSSVFVGNILALTSITVNNSATVEGRALAMTGAVTLNDDTFIRPSCAVTDSTTTTTDAGAGSSTSTAGGGSSSTTAAPGSSSTTAAPGITSSTLADTTSTTAALGTTTTAAARIATTTTMAGQTAGRGGTTTTAARTAVGLTARAAAVPAVVGAPRTGGESLPDPGLPWWAIVLGGLTAGAATAGALRFRRTPADRTALVER